MWSTAQASQLPRIKINNFHFYLLFTCLVVLFAPIWIRVNYGQYARNSKLHEPDSYLVTSHAIYLYLQRSVFSHNLLFVDLLIINGSTNMNKSVKFVMFFLSLSYCCSAFRTLLHRCLHIVWNLFCIARNTKRMRNVRASDWYSARKW